MSDEDRDTKKTTFFSKNPIRCPVCDTSFYKEDLLSGGGRLIAGELTEELHRTFEPSKKYGELYPLVYAVLVCPSCYYATYPQDFHEVKGEFIERLKEETDKRVQSVSLVFKDLDFTNYRGLKEGAASYFLAMMCYDLLDRHYSPTFKRALSALRAAWLLDALHRKAFGENYDYLSRLFYRKARFFYVQSVEMAQNGESDAEKILTMAKGRLHAEADLKIDYVKICNAQSLEEVTTIDHESVMLLAVSVGKTRLIDNGNLIS